MTHQYQFLFDVFHVTADMQTDRILVAPFDKILFFRLTTAKEENTKIGHTCYQLLYHLLHQLRGIGLSLMGSKGSNTYPALFGTFLVESLRQRAEVTTLCREDAVELDVYRIA